MMADSEPGVVIEGISVVCSDRNVDVASYPPNFWLGFGKGEPVGAVRGLPAKWGEVSHLLSTQAVRTNRIPIRTYLYSPSLSFIHPAPELQQ